MSSTLEELAEERQAVREAIESLRLTPVMFELGARPHPPRALYHAYLAQSDIFVGLYWQRYGWVAPGEQISGLEDEYVLSGDRPKLMYVKVAERRESQLEDLLERVRADDKVSYRKFRTAAELRSLLTDDLALLLSERFDQSRAQRASGGLVAPPKPPTSLVGRAEEIQLAAQQLRQPDRRLLTLVGPGGIGKTRLALAVAERVAADFPDGVAYVDLAGITEESLVMPAIAEALGVTETTGTPIGTAVRIALAGRRALLLLDNMERLVGMASELVDLLAACDQVRLLVTSRAVLNVNGERIMRVEPLELPPRDSEEEIDVASIASVRLFLDRAAATAPDFGADDRELRAIAEICRLLDGVPLAIELASARTRLLSPSELLRRMGHHRLPFLAGGPRDLPPRQQALRDTIEVSHGLLTTDAQRLFRRSGVFVGSATLDAFERVTNYDSGLDVLSALGVLLDVSLVTRVESKGPPRFGLLETVREFAVERLSESGESTVLREQHQAYYLDLAEAGRKGLTGGDQGEWLRRLDQDEDNLRAIFRRALRRGDGATCARLGVALIYYWLMRSRLVEGRRWMDETVAISDGDADVLSTAWTVGAGLAIFQGDLEHVELGIDEAWAQARHGRPDTLGYALMFKGFVSDPRNGDAEKYFKEGIRVVQGCDGPARYGAQLFHLYLLRMAGPHDDLFDAGDRALADARRRGDCYFRGVVAGILAGAAADTGRIQRAKALALESLQCHRELGNRSGEAFALDTLAAAEAADGQLERAGRLFGQARHLGRVTHSRHWRTELALFERTSRMLREKLGPHYEALFSGRTDFDVELDLEEIGEEASVTPSR